MPNEYKDVESGSYKSDKENKKDSEAAKLEIQERQARQQAAQQAKKNTDAKPE